MRTHRRLGPALAGLLLLALPALAAAQTQSQAVLDEINYVRANPQAYARELAQGRPAMGEDPDALDEAVAELQRQRPLPPLGADGRIDDAARDHVSAQAARGDVGHGAAGSLGLRLRKYGVYAGLSAENISYGYDEPRDVVRQLVVDSGVPSRGHRRNILSTGYSLAGVACGGHRSYGAMCVIDFAGALPEGVARAAR
ncbi:CAP domain-containing protein [Caulobacter hibisci]|uniref:CAP domain-containing protein n=1 Tax=Caulobacter hibisci TaxID=2035993 RepID=A0ABS0STL4_9CAUL|nr:CAP domain-containing protein [Caulobacter hibisci]MBI1683000.1 CAP domain-containing protein [Caulobacter hibisci]